MKSLQAVITGIALSAVAIVAHAAEQTVSVPDNALHQHSQTLPTVVLSGTFYAVIDGKRTEYPAGAYYKLPADLVHESGCTAAADCLLFQYQADAFDLKPVKC